MDGLPLLSYPPPNQPESDVSCCRKCGKEFNFLFTRQKRCNHCGYAYCASCADFQALMPRAGPDRGYEALPVCAFCMDMLTITASSKSKLQSLPLTRLRSYMKAYDIRVGGAALEKDDLIDTILRAKGSNGCLLAVHEEFYRKHSVPQRHTERPRARNIFSRSARQEVPTPNPQPQPRQYAPPPGPPSRPQQRQYAPPPGPPPPRARAAPPLWNQHRHHPEPPSFQTPPPQPGSHYHYYTPPPPAQPYPSHPPGSPNNFRPSASQTNFHGRSPYHPTQSDANRTNPPPPPAPPRPRSAAPTVPVTPARHPPPPLPVPSLDSLLQKSSDEIAHLSISILKSILFENRVSASLVVLEKQDLVDKVLTLVADERRVRELKEREEREEAERMEWARRDREREEAERNLERERKLTEEQQRSTDGGSTDGPDGASTSSGAGSTSYSVPKSSAPYSDRAQDGLCVICQDEHANMAIIDCGHLAFCKGCSEIVMKTSRECPLCRTRIITEQRLLRIFKT